MPKRHGNETEIHVLVRRMLSEYRILETRIKGYEMESRGEGILIEPSITSKLYIEEDDAAVLFNLEHSILTQDQSEMLNVLERYVADRAGFQYATRSRVVRLIKDIKPISEEHKRALNQFKAELEKTIPKEESVQLTPVEMIANARLEVMQHAKQMLVYYRARKMKIDFALDAMQQHYPHEHHILIEKYINKRSVADVCISFKPIIGIELPSHEYDKLRHDAVDHFADFAGIVVLKGGEENVQSDEG